MIIEGTILTSPGWPFGYDNGLDCSSAINLGDHNRIRLVVLDFDIRDYDHARVNNDW